MPVAARSQTAILSAGVIGGIALAVAVSFLSLESPYGTWAPVAFAVPLIAALMICGRLRIFGAIYLLAIIAASFFVAIYTSIITLSAVHGSLCLFCDAQQEAANMLPVQLTGAAGGAVGGALPLLALTLLGADMRDRKALLVMATATPLLALAGAFGLSGALPGMTTPILRTDGTHFLVWYRIGSLAPWQLVFGSTIAFVLGRHTPRARAARAAAA